jgi:hypothetical protein
MHRLRALAGWMLLATVLAGGVLGPPLHRVQHAVEQIGHAPEEPCHAPAVHNADRPLWTTDGHRALAPDCDLCATRVHPTPPLTSAVVVAAPLIRGPPTVG